MQPSAIYARAFDSSFSTTALRNQSLGPRNATRKECRIRRGQTAGAAQKILGNAVTDSQARLFLFYKRGGFYLEEQVVPADVTNRNYPRPVVFALYRVEDSFDFGSFAVGQDLDDIIVGGAHIPQDRANILDRIDYLTGGVVDISRRAGLID